MVAMVVASSGWVQNASFPTETNLNNTSDSNKMTAKGILICRDNSHAFQDRTLNLEQPVKIGRSVARTRAAADNAIFDCKVLSRNHALLWYNGGKFYLQDTRSSNGTFVNNQRLSATGSESAAKEVCSGDIVQFGVDVIESTKKVTHGCIIATLKLYLPDGKEAKASRSMFVTSPAGDVTLEDLYKLHQYVQEASRRENVLHTKLAYLQKLVDNTKKAANQSWKALIDEDRLLTRVKTVENQLAVYSKNFSDDKIKSELVKQEENKMQYQLAAKEALEKVHMEKLQVTQKLVQLEGRLNETEEECQSLHEISKLGQTELQHLATKYTTAQKNLAQLEAKLAEHEQSLSTEVVRWAAVEKQDLVKQVKYQSKIGQALQWKLNENRLDTVKIHKKITGLRNYMQTLQDMNDKLLSEDSKDAGNPIEAINAVLETLTEMMANVENVGELEDISDSEENQGTASQDKDSNQKAIEFDERKLDLSNDFAEYILPPQNSRLTLVNGKIEENGVLETTEDTCSVTSEDLSSLADSEEGLEKSVIEVKPLGIENSALVAVKHEVRFADTVGESVEAVDNRVSGVETEISEDRELSEGESKVDELEEVEKECEGEYIKTLKPLLNKNCDCSSQCSPAREYILQVLMSSLESLGGDDETESQQLVKRELDELRVWLVREPNDIVVDRLKEFYYRAKNENSRMLEITEELGILKEQYNACNEEKNNLSRQYELLKSQCGDLLNSNYSVPVQYVVPVVVALLWLLMEKMF